MDYIVPKSVLDSAPQVFRWRAGDREVWVKRRRPHKNPLGWWAQRLIYRVTGIILALPPDRPPGNTVRFEAETIQRLGELGLRVPQVLHVEDDYFVMSDAGVTLERHLAANPAKAGEFIDRAARELRALHRRDTAHGGAQIKNLTVRDGDIHFIDFEERIPRRRLHEFQVRDLFLFLLSLERAGHDPDIAGVCRSYGGPDGDRALADVCRALTQLWLVRVFDWRVFSFLSMRDIRGLCRLIHKAEALGPLQGAT